jgi:hypothetical protein
MGKSNPKKIKLGIQSRCKSVRKALVEHLEHELPLKEQRSVDEHLKVCPHCSAERATLKRTLDLLEQRNLPDPGSAFWSALRYRVRREVREVWAVPPYRPPFPARAWVPAVAFASLLVFLFLWWSNLSLPSMPGQRPLLAQLRQEGQRNLEMLGKDPLSLQEIELVQTPVDSLVQLIVSIPRPAQTLEQLLVREKMSEDPDLWEAVLEEDVSELPLEVLLDDLTESQLKELSSKLKKIIG